VKRNPIIVTVACALACAAVATLTLLTPPVASADSAGSSAITPVTDPTAPTGAVKPAPVLVISSYETDAKRLIVGTPFTLTLDISNETSRRANNVVVSIAGASAAGAQADAGAASSNLTVLGTGNAKFTGDILGDHRDSVSFEMVAGPGTPPGAATVPVTVSFEYGGVRQEVSYTIGLVFERDAMFAVATADIPKTAVVGEPFDASFELANAGSFTLNGMSMSVEASTATVTDPTLFVGTFEAAAAETIDVTIKPKKAGPLEVVLVASYRDDFGKVKSYRTTYKVMVKGEPKPSADQTDTGSAEKPAEEGNWFSRLLKSLFGLGS
jgi:hypothetical protein